jgi:hypothetical protein
MDHSIKTIVCLANSRKSSGRCIAGKLLDSDKIIQEWIRPVSARPNEEISEDERRYSNGEMPHVLDIIEVPVKEKKSTLFQKENYLIHDTYYWKKLGGYSKSLSMIIDSPKLLWNKDCSSYYGKNDRVSKSSAGYFNESLYLIKPLNLEVTVKIEGEEFNNPKRKIRAKFRYNKIDYIFLVTDPKIEKMFLKRENGEYHITKDNVFLCVSMGLPYQDGYCYKFVASIIGI